MSRSVLSLSIIAVAVFIVASSTALADFDIPKWQQQPDVTITAVDVDATTTPLYDDFLCFEPEDIVDVHIWGSWKDDKNVSGQTTFKLGFFIDIPAGVGGVNFSRPDLDTGPVWEKAFAPGEYKERLWKTHSDNFESWYSPSLSPTDPGYYDDNNHAQVWQYNFEFKDMPFEQEGTQEQPIVYWLGLIAEVPKDPGTQEPLGMFGWKASLQHWNDDAVFEDPADGPQELLYPQESPYLTPAYDGAPVEGDSIDLAFVLTVPEPATLAFLGIGGVGVLLRRRRK